MSWDDDRDDRRERHPGESSQRPGRRPGRGNALDGCQAAGLVLLWVDFSPALISGSGDDLGSALGTALGSAPLLLWLLTPPGWSDDRFDVAHRRRAEWLDTLAVILLWTWPLTCGVALAAVVRRAEVFLLPGP